MGRSSDSGVIVGFAFPVLPSDIMKRGSSFTAAGPCGSFTQLVYSPAWRRHPTAFNCFYGSTGKKACQYTPGKFPETAGAVLAISSPVFAHAFQAGFPYRKTVIASVYSTLFYKKRDGALLRLSFCPVGLSLLLMAGAMHGAARTSRASAGGSPLFLPPDQ